MFGRRRPAAEQARSMVRLIGDVTGQINLLALDSIRSAIQDVGEFVSSTAAAVEEQSAVTGEMSTSMQRRKLPALARRGTAWRVASSE